jgi:hypothetical protein
MEITNEKYDASFMSSDSEDEFKDSESSMENYNDIIYKNDIPFMPLLEMIQNEDNSATKKSKK